MWFVREEPGMDINETFHTVMSPLKNIIFQFWRTKCLPRGRANKLQIP